VAAFAALAAEGHLTHTVISPRADGLARAVATAGEAAPRLVFVQTPGSFPWREGQVRDLLRLLGSPPVVFWEGDAWGGSKQLPPAARAWLRHADAVFSVAVGEQKALLGALAPGRIDYVPNVLPLPSAEPPADTPPSDDIAFIGNRYLRFGLLERVVGNRDRARLVHGLQRLPGTRTRVYGRGWRGPGARGPVPFAEQVPVLRRARVTAGWDHYNHHHGYYSDRLPIALSTGRNHINSRQPGLDWLPGPDHGLHLADTPEAAVELARCLLRADPQALAAAGARGSAWVRERLTEREALLHMLSRHLPLPAPPDDPWAAFGPARCAAP
ncbi:glycosyltransferase family protein, partial [Streptomyces beijiangensis]